MNVTNCSDRNASSNLCSDSTIPYDEYAVLDKVFTLLAIRHHKLVNMSSNHPSQRTRDHGDHTKRKLQTMYNILLASLAGTDFLVGIAAQPLFISRIIFSLAGGSFSVYRILFKITQITTAALICLASLFHLVLISIERFVAMKYSLQYETMVNKFRSSCM